MKAGTRIRTTYRVRSGEGFILPGTEGKVLFAIGVNAYRCEFADIEIETGVGETKTVTTTVTVLVGYFNEIPVAEARKPLS